MADSYILNNRKTFRYVYPGIEWPEGADLSQCDPPACHPVTRPYYTLVDNGDVYITTPDGVVYYIGAGTNYSKLIFPLNSMVTAEFEPPFFDDLGNCGSTSSSITICWNNTNNAEGVKEQIIRPRHGFLIPWRPGSSQCNFTIGDDSDTTTGFVIPSPNNYGNPKQPGILEMPYANGYYTIQDGYDHCVVFYKGELIYEGKFNGTGIPARFGYGVAYCNSPELCCPVDASLSWEYETFQKWRQNDRSKFYGFSIFDKAYQEMGINDRGLITGGNVVHSTVDEDGFDINEDTVTLTVLPYIVDDQSSYMDEASGYWVCRVYHVTTDGERGEFCGSVFVEDSTAIIKAFIRNEEYEEAMVNADSAMTEALAAKQAVEAEIVTVQATIAQKETIRQGYSNEKSQRLIDQSNTDAGSQEWYELQLVIDELTVDIANVDAEIAARTRELAQLQRALSQKSSVYIQKELVYNTLRLGEAGVNEEALRSLLFNRVLYSFKRGTYWATPREAEQIGEPVLDCDYELLYRCTEKQDWKTCEGGAAAVKYKTWYEGTGYSASDSDGRFKLSKWMEECCKICYPSQAANAPCSQYKCGGGGCDCDAPTGCGDCYPVAPKEAAENSVENIPKWKHEVPGTCHPELAEILREAHPELCDDSNTIYQDGMITVGDTGYQIPTYNAQLIACPPDEATEQPQIERTVKCVAEVATAKLEQIGGRIHPIYGSFNPITNTTEETNYAYIVRNKTKCRERKDYTIIGKISGPQKLPGMVEFNATDIEKSTVDLNAANAVILRAPHDSAHDDASGFTPGFVKNTDSDEVKRYFTQFYPAYLTRPGFELPLNDSQSTGEIEPYYHLHEGPLPNAPGVDEPNEDGDIWHFVAFESKENAPWKWFVRWRKMAVVQELIQRLVAQAVERDIAGGSATSPTELRAHYKEEYEEEYYTQRQLDSGGLTEDLDETGSVIDELRVMPSPIQDPHVHEDSTKHGDVGRWYCQGTVVDYATALAEYDDLFLPNAAELSYTSGIWWKQWVQSWGDSDGLPIRVGLQVGDVFYCKADSEIDVFSDETTVPEYADRYWMWDGYGWKDGVGYFSDLAGTDQEVALFYKNKGQMDLKPKTAEEANQDGWEICATAKALFIGKQGSLFACGQLLAVNLNQSSKYHKAVFWNEKILWEREAYGDHFTSSGGEEMVEGMQCAGDTYTMAVYNVGNNRQEFRLWMVDYTEVFNDTTGDNRTNDPELISFNASYDYEDVPYINSVGTSWLTLTALRKYGASAVKNYLCIPSRSGKKLYLFYKGQLKKTYDEGYSSASGSICGPRYAAIKCPDDGYYDIWLDGELKHEHKKCRILLEGAIIVVENWKTADSNSGSANSPGSESSLMSVETAIVASAGEYTWVAASVSTYNTNGSGHGHSISCGLLSVAMKGDWEYYLIGNCPEAGNEPPDGVCNGAGPQYDWNAKYSGLVYNTVTQEIRQEAAPAVKFPNTHGACGASQLTLPDANSCSRGKYLWQFGSFILNAHNFISSSYSQAPTEAVLYGPDFISCSTNTGEKDYVLVGICHVEQHIGTLPGGAPCNYDKHLAAIGAVALWDDGTVRPYNWQACGAAAHPCIPEPDGMCDSHVFTACKISPIRCALSYDSQGKKALIVSNSGAFFSGGLANPCDCANVSYCGPYSQWRETADSDYQSYYKATLLPESGPLAWCCSDDLSPYIKFANGNVYYKYNFIGNFPGAMLIGCCGKAVLFFMPSGEKYFYVDGVLAENAPFSSDYIDLNLDYIDYNLTCCGIDYYLLQRGKFSRIPQEVEYTTQTETLQDTSGVTITKYSETCAVGQQLELEDGSTAVLKTVTSYKGNGPLSEPDQNGNRTQKQYDYQRPATWEVTTVDSQGNNVKVVFDHDYSYSFGMGENDPEVVIDNELHEERSGYVPWKYTESMTGREAYVYYKNSRIWSDPRVENIECFRYHNDGTVDNPEYHAEAAFATFYDDPWNNEKESNYYTWTTGGGDILTPSVTHHLWTTEQRAVKDVLPLFEVDVDATTPCDCEMKAKIKNAFQNVCIVVWEKEECTSTMNHSNDQPFTPFRSEFESSRGDVLYINDYNTAVRWDRLTGSDPVNEWVNLTVSNSAGTGGFWMAAPSYNDDRDVDNEPFDSTGRLVVSGNNSIYIWDKWYGRIEFNALTGAIVQRGVES